MNVVPIESLRAILALEPASGSLTWKVRPVELCPSEPHARTWNKQFAGKEAFTAANKGYRCGRIFDRMYQAHRVAFALHHGRWPEHQVDHIDGNPLNNSIANLREVTNAENHRNECRPTSNTSGAIGVTRHRAKWRAHIKVNFRQLHLGVFDTFEAAVAARQAAELSHGFHANHGRAA